MNVEDVVDGGVNERMEGRRDSAVDDGAKEEERRQNQEKLIVLCVDRVCVSV